MTRIGVGECWQEVNSFSPLRTTRADFDVVEGSALLERIAGTARELGGIIDALRSDLPNAELVPALSARAVPRGPVDDAVYTWIRDRFRDAFAGGDLDAVVLSLHGAMVTTERSDPEGDLLESIRGVVGDIPIVASLDHHANVTPRMVRAADGLVAFREHPHTGADIRATGERAARLAVTTLNGAVDPRMAFVRVPMVTTTGLSTTEGPMAALFDRRRQLEADGHDRLVSLCPVQPWLDVPDLGFAALVVSNGDFRSAATGASELARAAWNRRDDFDESFPSVDDAIDRAIHGGGPVVLADRGDVTLGGAPGDSPVVLRRCCDRDDATAVRAAIPIVDPAAVSTVHEAASEPVTLDVGGHFTPEFEPVTVTGRPVFDSPDPLRLAGDYYAGEPIDMGRRIVFRLTDRPIDLILSAKPGVTTDPSFFTDHDIAPNEADLLVVKSIGTFRPGFEPMAGAIMVCDTPGVCGTDLSQFDHRYARPVHPLDEVEPALEVVAGYRGT